MKKLSKKQLKVYNEKMNENSLQGILKAESERQKIAFAKMLEEMTEEEKRKFLNKTSNAVNVDETDDITRKNVVSMGERIAIKSLATIYQASGNPFILDLYRGLIVDIVSRKTKASDNMSDGYDVAQVAIGFLMGYVGKKLSDETDGNETDKSGNKINVLRACFRVVNKFVMGERQNEYKRIYLEDCDENGVYYEIPENYDIPTIYDFKAITAIIARLKLSAGEKQFLKYRMRGKSLEEIAFILNVKKGTIDKYRQRIKDKLKAVFNVDETNAENAERFRKSETKARKTETKRRNETPTRKTAPTFDKYTERTNAEKIAILKTLYKQTKNAERREKIRREYARIRNAERGKRLTEKRKKEIEKRIVKLLIECNEGSAERENRLKNSHK